MERRHHVRSRRADEWVGDPSSRFLRHASIRPFRVAGRFGHVLLDHRTNPGAVWQVIVSRKPALRSVLVLRYAKVPEDLRAAPTPGSTPTASLTSSSGLAIL